MPSESLDRYVSPRARCSRATRNLSMAQTPEGLLRRKRDGRPIASYFAGCAAASRLKRSFTSTNHTKIMPKSMANRTKKVGSLICMLCALTLSRPHLWGGKWDGRRCKAARQPREVSGNQRATKVPCAKDRVEARRYQALASWYFLTAALLAGIATNLRPNSYYASNDA